METIKIKRRDGSTIYSHTCENNDFQKSLEQAIAQRCDFTDADFSEQDLGMVDFRGVLIANANFAKAYWGCALLNPQPFS